MSKFLTEIIPYVLLSCSLLCGCASTADSSLRNTPSSGTDELSPVTKQSFYFDTVCQVTVYSMRREGDDAAGGQNMAESVNGTSVSDDSDAEAFRSAADAAIDDAFALCSDYEQILSKTVEGSDIWKINHAEGTATTVDSRTIDVIERGIDYGELSDGKFDITIGKAEDLWDFHADDPEVPDADVLAEAIRHVDYRNIVIDEASSTVQLKDPESEIDLGGIAKGYIADRVCDNLRENNVTSAIVSLGGNIECVGGKPAQNGFETDGTGDFNIGIETPYSHDSRVVGASPLRNGTMVTSGVYERYFEVDGKQYHHILDVSTGYPVDTDILGVTVKSSEGHSVDCDALATICLIEGCEKGSALIERLDGYEAAFVLTDDTVRLTSGMEFTAAE